MLQKLKKIINKKLKNLNFKKSLKKEKKRIFLDTCFDEEKTFKKRKKIIINFPKLKNIFSQNNIKNIYIWSVIFIILTIIILLFSPLFNIQKIDIIEIESWSWQDLIDLNVTYASIDHIRNKNIILLSQKDLWNQIINFQKNINKVEINKHYFPPRIEIKLSSYKAAYQTNINWKKYLVTTNWVFIPTNSVFFDKTPKIKVFLANRSTELIDFKKILQEKYLNKIEKLVKDISLNIVWIKIKWLNYYEKEREVHIEIDNDTKLIFDINTELDEQIKKISIFFKEHINFLKSSNINYIDLRIPNKIFYCENENKTICENNLSSIYKNK